jgi:ComF family protein
MLHLFDFLFPPRADEASLREISDDDFLALGAPQLVALTRPATVILLPFKNPAVRATIHEAKYHGSARAFKLLALILAEYLRDADDLSVTRFDLVTIIPIPLGRERHRERGFNQVEEVVRGALHILGEEERQTFTLEPDLLIRIRETASQVSLPRHKREENMRGAFGAAHPADSARTYIVIDDVLTTGATLQAAIDTLKAAGATHIIPLALAH